MTTTPKPSPDQVGAGQLPTAAARRVPLGGGEIARLAAALESAFTLDGLNQMMVTGLEGNLSLSLDAVVAVQGRNRRDICHDLVRWALRDERVGLYGLLAAALRTNPTNLDLLELQVHWQGVVFTAPACPYPGMKPFTAAEEGRFYGRDAEIDQAIDHLRRRNFLLVIGASGSGKSSLVAAGIVPALQMPNSPYFAGKPWVVHAMRPGPDPFARLAAELGLQAAPTGSTAPAAESERAPADAAALLSGFQVQEGTRLLLVVDQYEELFTTATADQRARFDQALPRLLALPGCYVIAAVRADFYANLIEAPGLPEISSHQLPVPPLRGQELKEAIALPARDVGVELTPQLVERLLADAGEEPGVLPFVQETLVMLWAKAERFVIDLDAYTSLVGEKSGRSGLQVALARHAEDVYQDDLADDAERAISRRILLRLIQFGEGRADTRRQQTADQLRQGIGADGSFDHVLAMLTDNRLLTLSNEARRVDLSHEALIGGWPLLREWIDERRSAELTRRRLEEKASERKRLREHNEAAGLLDVVELAEAERWVNGPDAAELSASDDLAALVADSRAEIDRSEREKQEAARRELEQAQALAAAAEAQRAAQALAAAAEARRAEEAGQSVRKLRKRNQGLAMAFAAALVAVAVAVLFFFNAQERRIEAEAAQQEAEQEARRAQAGELAVHAQNAAAYAANDPSLRLLLAISSVETTLRTDGYVTANAVAALIDAVASAPPYRMTLPSHRHTGSVNSAAYSPDGKSIVTASNDQTARIWIAGVDDLLMEAQRLVQRDPPLFTPKERVRYGLE